MHTFPRVLLAALVAVALLAGTCAARAEATLSAEQPLGKPDQAVLVPATSPLSGVGVLTAIGPDYLSAVSEAPQPFTHMLLRWEALVPAGASVLPELRASLDGSTWTDWGAVATDDDLWQPSDGELVHWSQPLYAGAGMRFWQARARLIAAPDGAAPELRRIEVNTVDARFGPSQPSAEPTDTATLAALGKPRVVSRTGWGSPDGQGSRVAPDYYPVNHMVVHHTEEANSLSSGQTWADRVRAIWSFHTYTRGWGDIGYNYLIDPTGVIYEGRAGGDDAVGFHDTANYGSMGVSIIGSYTSVSPQPASLNSLVSLLAWKASQKGIDPLGRSYYYGCAYSTYCKPYNPGAIVPNIAGHRQVMPGSTTCPGDMLMNALADVRQRVRSLLNGDTPQEPPEPKLDLLAVRYDRQQVPAGELLRVTFTVKNSGSVLIESQAPEAAQREAPNTGYDLAESYVYDEAECFLGTPDQNYPDYPKETGRFRVLLGPVEASRQPACAGETGGYPWRWGLNGSLKPGETRDVVGVVLLRTPGQLTLHAGAINEYVDYMATDVASTTLTVTNEIQAPASAAYDEALQPLAQVYRLGAVPDNLLARTSDPTSVVRGAYAGSFAWSGEWRDWGTDGPLPALPALTDRFVIEQVRSFVVPISGTYSFQITSDDGSWLWVDGKLVVSATGEHDSTVPATGAVTLTEGLHRLAFKMFERSGAASASYLMHGPRETAFGPVRDGFATGANDQLGAHFRQLAALNLVADDMGGAGVTGMRVALNDGPWQTIEGAVATLSTTQLGLQTVRYRAIDAVGNESPERTLQFRIDPNMVITKQFLPLVMR